MVNFIRLMKHLLLPDWLVHVRFKKSQMQQITDAISASEKLHDGEIRFAVEASLPLSYLLKNRTARDRAVDVFSRLRIWDTEYNNGVLIYFLLADNDFEIIVDRGLSAKLNPKVWQVIAQTMEQHCKTGDFTGAALVGVLTVTQLQIQYFPYSGKKTNELVNDVVIVDGQ